MTNSMGRYGAWGLARDLTPERARRLESAGFTAIWQGGSPAADLAHAEAVLEATESIVFATGIVNIWSAAPEPTAASYHRIDERFPGRFLLGIGVGHPEATAQYRTPYQSLVDYLDVLDAEGVPAHGRLLAALGPRVLRLAAQRSAGAHPYLVTPEHTRRARAVLGPDALLAPEQRVVLSPDPARARDIARPTIKPYLGRSNYTANLARLGYGPQDLTDPGSDQLIDDLTVSGDGPAVRAGLDAHLAAGADHVAVQLLVEPETDLDAAFDRLAADLFSG